MQVLSKRPGGRVTMQVSDRRHPLSSGVSFDRWVGTLLVLDSSKYVGSATNHPNMVSSSTKDNLSEH